MQTLCLLYSIGIYKKWFPKTTNGDSRKYINWTHVLAIGGPILINFTPIQISDRFKTINNNRLLLALETKLQNSNTELLFPESMHIDKDTLLTISQTYMPPPMTTNTSSKPCLTTQCDWKTYGKSCNPASTQLVKPPNENLVQISSNKQISSNNKKQFKFLNK